MTSVFCIAFVIVILRSLGVTNDVHHISTRPADSQLTWIAGTKHCGINDEYANLGISVEIDYTRRCARLEMTFC